MNRSVFFLLGRILVYMLVLLGLVSMAMVEGYSEGTRAAYSEDSLTEFLHDLLLVLATACFLFSAYFNRPLRPACAMLGGMCLVMLIRESDGFLDVFAFDGAWQLLATFAIFGVAAYLWRQPDSVAASIKAYAAHPSAGLFLAGCMVTLVFSRLFGRASFWQAVMGEGYMRVVKNIAEEATEVLGYGLMTLAAVELLVSIVASRPAPGKVP